MGRGWDASGIAYDVQLWREVLRVLRPGGHLLAFGGTRTYHRLACAVEDAGFEIRDSLHWLYGSGFPKGKACLKPAHEPLVLARKPSKRSDPLPGLDACRVAGEHLRTTVNGSTAFGLMNDDAWQPQADLVFESHPQGRWPPNVLLTHAIDCQPVGTRQVQSSQGAVVRASAAYGSESRQAGNVRPGYGPETVTAYACAPGCPVAGLDAQSGASKSTANAGQTAKNGTSAPGNFAGTSAVTGYTDSGTASRFYPQLDWSPGYDLPFLYQAKAPKSERPVIEEDGRKIAHPTVKPLALMRWLCRLVTPPGGLVLDPFAGSGATLEAAALEGFRAIGVEKEQAYCDLAVQRLAGPRGVDGP
jgi:hypothetical protein